MINESRERSYCSIFMKPNTTARMIRKWSIVVVFIFMSVSLWSQEPAIDSTAPSKDLLADTSINYDELFRDFDAFMDSILSPQSYLMASLSLGKGYYNFVEKGSGQVKSV